MEAESELKETQRSGFGAARPVCVAAPVLSPPIRQETTAMCVYFLASYSGHYSDGDIIIIDFIRFFKK